MKIEMLPTGTWIDEAGYVYCSIVQVGQSGMLHEPIIPPEWLERIRLLNKTNPNFWTVKELARLMQLTIAQIEEALKLCLRC
jgi:hypothetical protein